MASCPVGLAGVSRKASGEPDYRGGDTQKCNQGTPETTDDRYTVVMSGGL